MADNISRMSLKELSEEVRTLVGDNEDISNTWSNSDIVKSLNFAMQLYCKLTKCSYVEEAFNLNSDGVTTTFPNDYISIERVAHGTLQTKRFLLQSELKAETSKDPDWQQKTAGNPRVWFFAGGKTIKLLPKPQQTLSCVIGYIKEPVQFLNSTAVQYVDVTIPNSAHKYLKYAAAHWLLSIDGDQKTVQEGAFWLDTFNKFISGEINA